MHIMNRGLLSSLSSCIRSSVVAIGEEEAKESEVTKMKGEESMNKCVPSTDHCAWES